MSLPDRNGFKPQFLAAIAITALLVLIYRLGLQIQIPFIDNAAFAEYFKT